MAARRQSRRRWSISGSRQPVSSPWPGGCTVRMGRCPRGPCRSAFVRVGAEPWLVGGAAGFL